MIHHLKFILMKSRKLLEIGFILFTFLILFNCSGERDKFRNELSDMVDDLCQALSEFDYRKVVDTNKSIQNHFNNVSLAFLREDLDGFDDWAIELQKDVDQHRLVLYNEIQFFKSRYEENKYSLNPVNLGVYAKFNDKNELYFVTDDGYICSVEKLFNINLEIWLQAIKNQSKKFQE